MEDRQKASVASRELMKSFFSTPVSTKRTNSSTGPLVSPCLYLRLALCCRRHCPTQILKSLLHFVPPLLHFYFK